MSRYRNLNIHTMSRETSISIFSLEVHEHNSSQCLLNGLAQYFRAQSHVCIFPAVKTLSIIRVRKKWILFKTWGNDFIWVLCVTVSFPLLFSAFSAYFRCKLTYFRADSIIVIQCCNVTHMLMRIVFFTTVLKITTSNKRQKREMTKKSMHVSFFFTMMYAFCQ